MRHWIEERVIETPHKIAIQQEENILTYEDLLRHAKKYAKFLNKLNLDRVALYIKNDIHHAALIIGAWLENIELVMINTKLTYKEIENQLHSINVHTVLSYQSLKINQKVININDIEEQSEEYEIKPFNINKIATIMFTSGTTGPAKAVPQTFNNHYYSAIGCEESLGFDKSTRWLSVLPIYHISGLSVLIRSLIFGFTVIMEPKFETNRVMELIKNNNITHISLVPQTLQWLIDADLNEPYNLEKILLGGAKLSPSLISASLSRLLPIYNSFGMTETCSQFVTASPDMLKEEPETVGKVPSNVNLKIINSNEQGHGEMAVLGENVMNGYLTTNNPEQDFINGYFKTGDIGSINDEGYIFIYDRRKDLIISGGENIYPFEIEHVVLKHLDIINCVAVPVEDEKWGQVPALVYESTKQIKEDDLVSLLNDNLAKYKHPKYFYEINEIPRTSTGKLSRHKVKAWVDYVRK